MPMTLSETTSPRGEPSAAGSASSGDDTRAVPLRGNRFDSRDIFKSGREITIAHGEETYRLRLTAQNKLILTK